MLALLLLCDWEKKCVLKIVLNQGFRNKRWHLESFEHFYTFLPSLWGNSIWIQFFGHSPGNMEKRSRRFCAIWLLLNEKLLNLSLSTDFSIPASGFQRKCTKWPDWSEKWRNEIFWIVGFKKFESKLEFAFDQVAKDYSKLTTLDFMLVWHLFLYLSPVSL